MKISTTVQNALSYRLNYQVSSLLQQPECENCGVIIAQVNQMGPIELQDLETRLGMEDANVVTIPSYEQHEKLLLILFPRQTLAYTHFLSLSTKDYLQNAGLLAGKIAVAAFPESATPEEAAMAEFLALLMTPQESTGQDISVFYRQAQMNDAPTIVVIDQNIDLLEFLQARLSFQGYDVRPAQDGREGLDLINETPPDVVITELTLPTLDGYQLIHRIRQSRDLRNQCKIMVLTDLGLEEEVSKCFELGVSDVMKKPFSPVELEARIRRLLA
jgi:two-component system OmpR family response regulator